MGQSKTFKITNQSLCFKKKKKKSLFKFKGCHPAALRSSEAVEVQRIEGKKRRRRKKKHEIGVGCDGLFLSNSSTHWVRSSRPAAPHLAKDKANRGGRRCEGWRWMGPLQGSLAHAGCDVCVCKCVRVPLRSWAQSVEGGVRAQTSQRLTSNSASCACGLSFFVVSEEGGALVFASLALKAETTPSCDCFAKHKRYFCPFSVADCL